MPGQHSLSITGFEIGLNTHVLGKKKITKRIGQILSYFALLSDIVQKCYGIYLWNLKVTKAHNIRQFDHVSQAKEIIT